MSLRSLAALVLALPLAAAPMTFVREGKGPAILLVHGYGGNREVWKDAAAALVKDHTVVRVDLPGSGGTEGPATVEGAADFPALARDLAALVRRERLVPCLIVGHSMGGPISARTVLEDPAAFRGLVLVDSFLGSIPQAWFEPVLAGLDKAPREALAAFYKPMSYGSDQLNRLVDDAMRLSVPTLKAYLRGMARFGLEGRQAQLKLPVVQLQAGPLEKDPDKRAKALAAYGFDRIPGLRVVPFPGAAHWLMWDQPQAFLEALRTFEAGLAPRP